MTGERRRPAASNAAPTIDFKCHAGDEGALVAREIEGCVGEVRGRAEAPERYGGDEARAVLGRVSPHEVAQHRRVAGDRAERIDANFLAANSIAIALVSEITAPLLPLYQTRPGRGRSPAVDAVLMMAPPPRRSSAGTAWMAAR